MSKKLNVSSLLWEIRSKFILPAIKTRETLLFKYLASMDGIDSNVDDILLRTSSGMNFQLYSTADRYINNPKYIYMFELPDYNQAEITKHIRCLDDLTETTAKVKAYLSYLNNKSNSVTDVAYALPTHINQLVPMITPTEYLEHDLRDPEMYTLLNELQIKLLLLS